MRVTAASDIGNVPTIEDIKRFVSLFQGQVKDALNGGISTDNLRCKVASVTFAAANTQTQVAHGLGVVPVGYIKLTGPNIAVFDASLDNTSENIYVQASGTGTVTLLILG